jgi:hypothetical protein
VSRRARQEIRRRDTSENRSVRPFVLAAREVVEVAEEHVEAVHGRQELVAVAEMILAELPGRVAERLEQLGERRVLLRQPFFAIGNPTFRRPVRIGLWPVMNAARSAVQDCWP